ncbi:antiviral reverse transcriptase Drt2 [uncultured Aquimarina sp.]|uniref:antiviral reverse transcriptase Drt2 n=1 Tax=uncultured Aquimarina sp. TaxID=575652 RepID=UPI00262F48F7|nr:antiviral reverse transcriptase Drt2 [uncultured Aquimarina sp.]
MDKIKKYSKEHNELFSEWIAKEKRAFKSGKRRYLHFDPFINIYKRTSFFKEYFSKEKNVASHSFYPFLRSTIKTQKVKWQIKQDGTKERVWLPFKKREIFYASHFDAFIFSWYSTILSDRYEEKLKSYCLQNIPIAYRSIEKKCNIDFAKETFDHIKERKECVTIALDFSGFFDNMDHELLKKSWCAVINEDKLPKDHYKIFRNITNFDFIDNDQVLSKYFPFIKFKNDHPKNKRITTPEEFRFLRSIGLIKKNPFTNQIKNSVRKGAMCGIPQGLPISATLSNIYLLEFDKILNEYLKLKDGFYRRYSDDILIVCTKENLNEIKKIVYHLTDKFELELNHKKTDITEFKINRNKLQSFYLATKKRKNMQYLGFEFNGDEIYIRSSSIGRYHRKMKGGSREIVKSAFGKKAKGETIFIKKLILKYTNFGKNNFISYSIRAANSLSSITIKKQTKNSSEKLKKTLKQKAENRKSAFKKKKKPIKPIKFFN